MNYILGYIALEGAKYTYKRYTEYKRDKLYKRVIETNERLSEQLSNKTHETNLSITRRTLLETIEDTQEGGRDDIHLVDEYNLQSEIPDLSEIITKKIRVIEPK